jgi:hypothetical protein
VRTSYPLRHHLPINASDMVPFGLASTRIPVAIKTQVRQLLGLDSEASLPIALECDDLRLLKHVVLASIDEAVSEEVAAGLLHNLTLINPPT